MAASRDAFSCSTVFLAGATCFWASVTDDWALAIVASLVSIESFWASANFSSALTLLLEALFRFSLALATSSVCCLTVSLVTEALLSLVESVLLSTGVVSAFTVLTIPVLARSVAPIMNCF